MEESTRKKSFPYRPGADTIRTASANIVIAYPLIRTFPVLIFPELLIHAFYLFSTYLHFLLIHNFLRAYLLIKY